MAIAWTPGDCYVTIGGDNIPTLKGLECVFKNILYVIVELALLATFVMLLVGGFKYLTSGGDPKATEAAQHTLTYAILGLIALVLVWLTLKLIKEFTGIDVTRFQIIP